jgi:hypothetical protein
MLHCNTTPADETDSELYLCQEDGIQENSSTTAFRSSEMNLHKGMLGGEQVQLNLDAVICKSFYFERHLLGLIGRIHGHGYPPSAIYGS